MKKHVCSTCHKDIDPKDFFMVTRCGKICSDCLMETAPVEPESAHLFRQRGLKVDEEERQKAAVIPLQLKEAL